MTTYRNLMQEIKFRSEAIDDILTDRLKPVRLRIAEEYCYLQLRLICEVLAIACLIVHGNLKPKPKLFETYKADWIMSELGKLHPKFFPRPLEVSARPDRAFNFVDLTSDFLTKGELEKLWSRHAGSVLHRGSAKSVLEEKPSRPDFQKIVQWREKLRALLSTHIIATPDEEWLLYVVMHEQGTGKVASALLSKHGKPTPPHLLSGPFPLAEQSR